MSIRQKFHRIVFYIPLGRNARSDRVGNVNAVFELRGAEKSMYYLIF